MLYLDSSLLVKAYLKEADSESVLAKLAPSERTFTSSLSFAEILAAFARKFREGLLSTGDWRAARAEFRRDWELKLSILEVNSQTLASVEILVARHPLRGANSVHLSTALCLRDNVRVSRGMASEDAVPEFCTADRRLAEFANLEGLKVFLPA
jgi:hypothetical protein